MCLLTMSWESNNLGMERKRQSEYGKRRGRAQPRKWHEAITNTVGQILKTKKDIKGHLAWCVFAV